MYSFECVAVERAHSAVSERRALNAGHHQIAAWQMSGAFTGDSPSRNTLETGLKPPSLASARCLPVAPTTEPLSVDNIPARVDEDGSSSSGRPHPYDHFIELMESQH